MKTFHLDLQTDIARGSHNLAELSRKTHAGPSHNIKSSSDPTGNQIHTCASPGQTTPAAIPVEQDEEDDTVELEDSSMAHILWNVIVSDRPDFHPDAFCVSLEDDDMFLMYTDGSYQEPGRRPLKEIMGAEATVSEICETLIDEALEAGVPITSQRLSLVVAPVSRFHRRSSRLKRNRKLPVKRKLCQVRLRWIETSAVDLSD